MIFKISTKIIENNFKVHGRFVTLLICDMHYTQKIASKTDNSHLHDT